MSYNVLSNQRKTSQNFDLFLDLCWRLNVYLSIVHELLSMRRAFVQISVQKLETGKARKTLDHPEKALEKEKKPKYSVKCRYIEQSFPSVSTYLKT